MERLPEILKSIPADCALVVFHTHVMNQLPEAARERLQAILAAESARRDVWRLGNDLGGGTGKQYVLTLQTYRNGQEAEIPLAHCDGHGVWLEWLSKDL